jgi:anaphase-promoting complex subunit 2
MPLQGRSAGCPSRKAEGGVSQIMGTSADGSNLKRLLHPGAETKDVISQYISTIRCLRILDPPGVLLHKVAEPIRRHLKGRSDTVKCVVATLVEGDELQDENEAGGLIQTSNDETVEDFLDPKWDPEPVDAAPRTLSASFMNIS